MQLMILARRYNIKDSTTFFKSLGMEIGVLPTDVLPISSDPDGYLIGMLDAQYIETTRTLPDNGADPTAIKASSAILCGRALFIYLGFNSEFFLQILFDSLPLLPSAIS
jgi:hypothetical protein